MKANCKHWVAQDIVKKWRYGMVRGRVSGIERGEGYVILKYYIGCGERECYVRIDDGDCRDNVLEYRDANRSMGMDEASNVREGAEIWIPVVIYSYMPMGISIPWVMHIDEPYICCIQMDDMRLRLYEEEWGGIERCENGWVRERLRVIGRSNCMGTEGRDADGDEEEETGRYKEWKETWESGYEREGKRGGEKWEECSAVLRECTRKVVRDGEEEWEEITIRRRIK